MLSVKKINISDEGKKVTFDYELSKEIKKYFSSQKFFVEYDVVIASVPENILIIPFLANVLPISWFAGFDVYVNELDKEFYEAMSKVKLQFEKFYPKILERKSNLIVENLIDSQEEINFTKNAMLFSGGVDAYTTYLRHFEEKLDLITIWGADIKLNEEDQWQELYNYSQNTELIKNNDKFFIKTNLRDFYTFKVDKLLVNLGWWGKVQHGLALTCICAPLAYIKKYSIIYIASSYTRKENYDFIIWGSMPEIDNDISWAITNIKHDADELTRQEKINEIISKSRELKVKPKLRVCYNEFKSELNCNTCEKCCRTIFAIMIMNECPNKYGFNIDIGIFDYLNKIMKKRFTSEGNRLFWIEIYNQTLKSDKYFNSDMPEWNNKYTEFINNLNNNIQLGIHDINGINKIKFNIINKLPKLFNIYLKIRKKLP